MVFRPEVFVSATPVELDAYREVVRKTMREIGATVVEQLDYSVPYGPLQGLLYQQMQRCEAVIHLAGRSFGLEPADRTLGSPRRSFGHYELDVARSAGKTIFSFISAPSAKLTAMPAEDDERRSIQKEHLRAVERAPDCIGTFNDPEDLARQIRALRPRIMLRRKFIRIPRESLGVAFIGRQQLCSSITAELRKGGVVVLHPPVDGPVDSGMGRTTIAFEIGWRLHQEGAFPFVFTVPGGPRVDMEVALAALARSEALGILPDEVAGHRARLDAVLKWLRDPERRGKWLLIVDGIDEPANWLRIRKLLPSLGEGSVLITSRLKSWPELRSFPVGPWGVESARIYLLSHTMPNRPPSRADQAAADRIAEGLGRLPLGLEIGAGFIRHGHAGPAQFVEGIDKAAAARGSGPLDLPDVVDPARMVKRAVASLDPGLQALMRQLGCMAPQPASIPLMMFEQRGDTELIRNQIAALIERNLLYRYDDGRSVSIHRFVKQVISQQAQAGERATAVAAALGTVETAFRRAQASSPAAIESLVPHMRALLSQIGPDTVDLQAAELASQLGRWLQESSRPSEAEPLFRQALAIEEKRRGKDSPEVSPRIQDVAHVLRIRGRLREAEGLSRRALRIAERGLGRNSPEIVGDIYQLASCLRAQHRIESAETLYRRALQIEEQHWGQSHPRVAVALHRLAGLLEAGRRWFEAEAVYRRAIEIDEKAVGPNHPRVIAGLYNLAAVLSQARRGPEAEALLRRALAQDDRTYGNTHPEITPALRLLAEAVERRGAMGEAEELWRRIIAANESLHGASLTELAADRLSLAALLYNERRSEEARPLSETAIRGLVAEGKRMHRTHPYLKPALQLLSLILQDGGLDEAQIQSARQELLGGARPGRVHARI